MRRPPHHLASSRTRPSSRPSRRRAALAAERLEDRVVLTQAQYGLFDTGLDAAGVLLGDGAADAHYALTAAPAGAATGGPVAASPLNAFWLANGPATRWIAPTANQTAFADPSGSYTYETTFTLPSGVAFAGLSGAVASDNSVVAIRVNGVNAGFSAAGYAQTSAFALPGSLLVAGRNTLEFDVLNDLAGDNGVDGPNPTGLYVQGLAVRFAPTVAVDQPAPTALFGGTLSLTGTFSDLDAGDAVTITADRGNVNQSASNPGTFTVEVPGVTASGQVTITATDGAGNARDVVVPFTVRTNAPVIAQPAAALATPAATATIAGTADAGALVELYDDANGNGVADPGEAIVGTRQLAAGATAFAFDQPLAAGAANRFVAVATLQGLASSAPAAVPTITQDSTAPAAPVITYPTAPLTIVSPSTTNAFVTLTAEAGSFIKVYRDDDNNGVPDDPSAPVYTQQIPAGTTDTFLIPPLPPTAVTRFLITATDAAGNESAPAALPPITVVPPASGVVFLDRNANGVLDPGEPGIQGRVVYLDLNDSGTRDADEPTATTGPQGRYEFSGSAYSLGTVREFVPADASYRYAVNQDDSGAVYTQSIGVTPFSPVVPVPIVPRPGAVPQAGDADSNYVQTLYETVLGREPGTGEVAGWVAELAGGMTPAEVAARFVNSTERRTFQVAFYYRNLLGRDLDPLAQIWISNLTYGTLSDQQVVAGILNSPEYQSAHADPDAFVRDLYLDVLGRVGGESEVDSWRGTPATPYSTKADGFVMSPESCDAIVDSFYANFLRRDRRADPTAAFWGDRLAAGASATAVELGILQSAEFLDYARSEKGTGATPA